MLVNKNFLFQNQQEGYHVIKGTKFYLKTSLKIALLIALALLVNNLVVPKVTRYVSNRFGVNVTNISLPGTNSPINMSSPEEAEASVGSILKDVERVISKNLW